MNIPLDDLPGLLDYNEKTRKEGKYQHNKLSRWSTADDKSFSPSFETVSKIPCGIYEIKNSMQGISFNLIESRTENFIKFPQTNIDKVIEEIENFWNKEFLFKQYNLTYKRGIILYGKPGTGKSVLLQLIIENVIKRNGIVIKFTIPELFLEALRIFRQIEPETPIVVCMEDIDSILESTNESIILNILDGVEKINKIVFLATTNYIEKLSNRVINRPSRFDKRFKISTLDYESRKLYFSHLIKDKNISIDLDKWAKDTDGFTISHLKELFITVVILGNNYEESLKILIEMKDKPIVDKENNISMGFGVPTKGR